MTRQDYELIAAALAKYCRSHRYRVVMPTVLAEHVADALASTSLGFDRARFIAAATKGTNDEDTH